MLSLELEAMQRGVPYPFGATTTPNGVNFAIHSKHATSALLVLFDAAGVEQLAAIPLKARTGDVWHIHIEGLPETFTYGYRIDGPKGGRNCFHPDLLLIDPYAKALVYSQGWGQRERNYKGAFFKPQPFDWELDTHLETPLEKLIIYEVHVRSFSAAPSSQTKYPGTYAGFIEKIPYLTELGINAVELLPVYAFDECDNSFSDPSTGQRLLNVWGYSPISFFAPMPCYANAQNAQETINSFKELVKALHKAGIEVILDVVYNHTGEGGMAEEPISLKGIDAACYYHFDSNNYPMDFTGCGNSLNANHIYTKELILTSLRYWVTEMHIDGFRFDLASVLNRGHYGHPMATSPAIDSLSQDPILAKTKLIAEPWDAAGMYQVGAFYPQEDRWCEWNGKYRDSVRRFINNLGGARSRFATRISGSQDLYGHCRSPTSSINFITAHDGFTLADLTSYSQKHNLTNGEENRDGSNDNISWNCGCEGETDDETILALRARQQRNFAVALFTSQGVPMMLMGDEYGHSKGGNNNSYSQDNALNWFCWELLPKRKALFRFFQGLIALRKRKSSLLERTKFLTPQDIIWYDSKAQPIDWQQEAPFLAYILLDHTAKQHLFIAFNASTLSLSIDLPQLQETNRWHRIVDTGLMPPYDYCDPEGSSLCSEPVYPMLSHSSIILEALP